MGDRSDQEESVHELILYLREMTAALLADVFIIKEFR